MKHLYTLLLIFLALFTQSRAYSQYCVSQYSSGCGVGDMINNFSTTGGITNITNLNSGCSPNANIYYPNMVVTVNPGATFNFSVQAGPTWSQGFRIWVDWNNNGNFNDPGENIWNSGGSATTPYTGSITVPPNVALNVNLRMRVRCDFVAVPIDPCASQFYGETEDYNVFVRLIKPDNDAGVAEITSPNRILCSNNVSNNLSVRVRNYGKINLNSFRVVWNVNNTWIDSINVNANLFPGTDTILNLGNYTSNFGIGDQVFVQTKLPNNVNDSIPANDFKNFVIQQGISGIYHVGGPNPNFTSITQVEAFIDSIPGVCDTLMFLFHPDIYNGQLFMERLHNTAPTRPVIFRSVSNDVSDVTIQLAPLANKNYIVNLDNTSYTFFEGMTIRNNSTTNARVFRFTHGNDNIFLNNCNIYNNYIGNATNANFYVISNSDTSYDDGIYIRNCEISGGNKGVALSGRYPTAMKPDKEHMGAVEISNCTFKGQTRAAISILIASNVSITNNKIIPDISYAVESFGIECRDVINSCSAIQNSILSNNNFPAHGIYFENCITSSSKQNYIYNNTIKLGLPNLNLLKSGVSIKNTSFTNIVHNSVMVEGSNDKNISLYMKDGGGNQILNNIFVLNGDGHVVYLDTGLVSPFYKSDHNNFYPMGIAKVAWRNIPISTLGSWSNLVNDDFNSLSINPHFFDTLDLHVCNEALDNAGTPVSYATKDIDGETRSSTNPDIGADEFASIYNSNLKDIYYLCFGDSLMLRVNLNYDDSVIWNGVYAERDFLINQSGTYYVHAENACGVLQDTFNVVVPIQENLGADINICAGSSDTLHSSIVNGSYLWNTNQTSSQIIVNAQGIYSIQTTDSLGCTSFDTVYVTASKVVSLPNDTTLCDGIYLFLNPGTGPGNYTWSNGSTSPTILANLSGTYTVSYTDAYNCSSTDGITVTYLNRPIAAFTDIISYTTVELFNQTPDATNYYWTFGDGGFSNVPNPIHIYYAPGTYTLSLEVSNICGQSTTSKDITITYASGISEVEESKISVFPNPAKELINIQSMRTIQQIEIYNMQGKLVYQNLTNNKENSIKINTTEFSSGIYLLKLKTNDKYENLTFKITN